MQNGFHFLNKPLLGAQLNRSHPSASGLKDCLLWNEGQGQIVNNLANPSYLATGTGTPTWTATSAGSGGRVAGSQSFDIPEHGNYVAGDFAIRVVHIPSVWAGGFVALFDKETSSSSRELAAFFDTSGNMSYATVGSALAPVSIATGMTVGKVWDFVMTRTGSTGAQVNVYVNGLLKGSFTPSGAVAVPGPLLFGRSLTAGTFDYQGTYLQAQIWGRALGPAEIAALYAEPYGFINPPAVRRAAFRPAAGGAVLRPAGLAIGAAQMQIGI